MELLHDRKMLGEPVAIAVDFRHAENAPVRFGVAATFHRRRSILHEVAHLHTAALQLHLDLGIVMRWHFAVHNGPRVGTLREMKKMCYRYKLRHIYTTDDQQKIINRYD